MGLVWRELTDDEIKADVKERVESLLKPAKAKKSRVPRGLTRLVKDTVRELFDPSRFHEESK